MLEFKIIFLLLTLPLSWGYYCEWAFCRTDQYCCGDNLCCDYVYSLWYFWVGILFSVLVLLACGSFFRSYYRSWRLSRDGVPFTSLPTETTTDEDPLFQGNDNKKSRHQYH